MKIAEVSEKYAISVDTLRYYERIGLIPPVTRTESGIREYGETDIKRVEFVKCLRNAGLPIEALIEYMTLLQQGEQTSEARREILVEQRAILATRLAEMQKTLELLDYKISVYEQKIKPKEKGLN
jgi:DNA-binding transcriptional MerR regulator